MTNPATALATRTGLPSEFQLILAEYPRAGWPDHRDFNGLAAFWLDRHLSFRKTFQHLAKDGRPASTATLPRMSLPSVWSGKARACCPT